MWKASAIATWVLIMLIPVYWHLSQKVAGGGGHYEASPDGTAIADISSYRLQGGILQKDSKSIWIEISITDKNNGNKQLLRYIDHDIDDEMFARGGGTIKWNKDSSGASYSVGKRTFDLQR